MGAYRLKATSSRLRLSAEDVLDILVPLSIFDIVGTVLNPVYFFNTFFNFN